jgi:uncharacterized membrane protein
MKRFFIGALVTAALLTPALVLAQTGFSGNTQPTGYSGNSGGTSNAVVNPLGNINSFCGLIKAILQGVIAIGIPIAVLFIVFAGFKFVLALGNPGKLQEARKNLMYTLIGIGIFLGAWLLALVIANTVNALGAGSSQSQIISCN